MFTLKFQFPFTKHFPVLLIILILLLATSCRIGERSQLETPVSSTPEILSPGDHQRSISFDGLERTYNFHMPIEYDPSQKIPIVLVFHGFGLDAEEMMRITGFNDMADEEGFVVVYPNGTGEKKSWNGGECCGEAAVKNINDVGFVGALITDLDSIINADLDRIYATGFSNGAIFAYRLACELANQIAAIGPVAATQALQDVQSCTPQRAIPIIHFHGTNDKLNPYNGGTIRSGVEFISVKDAQNFWVEINNCSTPPDQIESGNISLDLYANCSQGSSLEFYSIIDGEHAWPGGEAVTGEIGQPNMEISATELMWEFFRFHPLR